MTHPQPARPDHLTTLADLITELVDPHPHTERFQRDRPTGVETTTTRRGRVTARRVTRQHTHATTVPSLLDALRHACIPAASTEQTGASGGAFESKPPLEVEAVAVYRGIRDDATRWARKLHIDTRQPLPTVLRRLVSATLTVDQLGNLAGDAARWVREARLAVGLDAAPLTIGEPCPICARRNAVVIFGVGLAEDRQHGACTRCGVTWSHDQLGILADMLRYNRTQGTMCE